MSIVTSVQGFSLGFKRAETILTLGSGAWRLAYQSAHAAKSSEALGCSLFCLDSNGSYSFNK